MSEAKIHEVRPVHHYGVYGRFIHNGRLLTIRKDYGLYKGLLDLPGGQPDGDETPDETLARLVKSETGARVEGVGTLSELDFVVTARPDGTPAHFHHTATIADVDLNVLECTSADVEWFDIDGDPGEVSELVRRALGSI